jgi:hypothetical protein
MVIWVRSQLQVPSIIIKNDQAIKIIKRLLKHKKTAIKVKLEATENEISRYCIRP